MYKNNDFSLLYFKKDKSGKLCYMMLDKHLLGYVFPLI